MAATAPRTIGAWQRHLLPDLSAMLTVATLAYCLFLFGAGHEFFRDSDAGWHIRNGEAILTALSLPRADPYSFSKSAQPWYAWEWGSDVLMAAAHKLDGLRGVTILFAGAIGLCTWLWCRLNFAAGGEFLIAALLAPLMITTSSLHWLARPHVFSWLFLLAALLYAERAPSHIRLSHLAAIAGVTSLWANLHASFFLAPGIAVIYAISHWVRPLIWPLDARTEQSRARWFLYAAIAAAAGSLLNPYGWQLHAHVLSYLANDDLISHVAEFQSFNFHQKDAAQVALTLVLGMAAGILALGQRRVAHFLLSILLVFGALRSARVLPLVALLILPLANGIFSEALRNLRGLRPSLQRALDAAMAYSARLHLIDRRLRATVFVWASVGVFLIALRTPAFSSRIGFPADRFPVAAAEAVDKLPASARLLAPDSFGGYLIYRFAGARKVYFDGRSDFYGADFMKQYLILINAQPGWRDIVRSYRFTHALLPRESALKAALEQAGWAALHNDSVAALLEAR